MANMHGDEVVGRELVLYFAHELCSKYGSDSRLTRLVDNLDIYLLPTMNPDGELKDFSPLASFSPQCTLQWIVSMGH